MALRLHNVVLSGEIFNLKNYSTHGWLEFRGAEQPICLELTGNCGRGLIGSNFRFTARPEMQARLSGDGAKPREFADLDWIALRQVGPTGTMELREVKWFDADVIEFYRHSQLGEPLPTTLKPCLYLEWYSQNGRCVLELIDPEFEIVERRTLTPPRPGAHLITDPAPAPAGQPETPPGEFSSPPEELEADFSELPFDDSEPPSEEDDELEEEDSLQRELDRQADDIDRLIADDNDDSPEMRELKLMDESLDSGLVTPLFDMIDEPLQLPKPADVGEDDAEPHLMALLVQLAIQGIAIHVCEHYTPRETYRWLLEDIFPEPLGRPELRRTQWVQGFDTSESCPACDAEFERKWAEQERRNRPESPRSDDQGDDPPLSS